MSVRMEYYCLTYEIVLNSIFGFQGKLRLLFHYFFATFLLINFLLFFFEKRVELEGGGSGINGSTVYTKLYFTQPNWLRAAVSLSCSATPNHEQKYISAL